jgi:hypothetical protein
MQHYLRFTDLLIQVLYKHLKIILYHLINFITNFYLYYQLMHLIFH